MYPGRRRDYLHRGPDPRDTSVAGAHQRRILLYKYLPGFQALAACYRQAHAPDYLLDMTDEERATLG